MLVTYLKDVYVMFDVRVNVWNILRMPSAFHESQGVNKVDPALE